MIDAVLAAKRIVVTGAGGRLGSRMVEEFSRQAAETVGLVVSDEEGERVPRGSAGSVTVRVVDVTNEQAVVDCFGAIREEEGEIDALVHTVGMWSARSLLDTSQEDWELMIRVNLTSAFLCFREAIRIMKPNGGTLIGISSRQGVDGGVAEQSAYSAAKAGVARLVESAADEFGGAGVTCHSIAPSTILFGEEGKGVQAAEIIDAAAYLIGHGRALSGTTIRMYGD